MTGRRTILEKLLSRPGFTVMDGGMGTSIEDRGVSVRNALWGSAALLSEEGRRLNDHIHREFAEAGAELLIANTHNASLASCEAYLQSSGAEAGRLMRGVNTRAVESARGAAVGRELAVAACVGSADAPYAKTASLTAREVVARLGSHAELLAELPIDLLLFEMVSTSSEVEGVAEIVARLSEGTADLKIGVGFTCDESGRTHGGVSMSQAVRAFDRRPPDLWFVQCTRHDRVERPLRELRDLLRGGGRLGVYANDGREWRDQRWHGDRITPEHYRDTASSWAELGAKVIGGCCGTGPEHIAALAQLQAGP